MPRRWPALLLALALTVGWSGTALAAAGQVQSANAFTDIRGSADYWDIVQLVDAGVIRVPADGLFQPTLPVTRLQFAVWLARALHLPAPAATPAFSDAARIPAADLPLVAAVVGAGMMQGVAPHVFGPDLPMTRAQVATIVGRDLERRGQTPDARYLAIWEDGATIPAWALPATVVMRDALMDGLAVEDGVACRPEACFGPNQPMTRAGAAALLVRYLTYLSQHFHGPALPKAVAQGGFALGFWDSGTQEAYANLTAHGAAINYLVDGGYDVLPGGSLSGFDNAQNLAWVRSHPQTQIWMMVQSLSAAQNAFLASPTEEGTIVAAIAAAVGRVGYAGVNLDVEGLPAAEGPAYTAFVAQVAAAVHAEGAKVSVDVPAPFAYGARDPSVGAYDYQALGQVADQIVVMAYSYHWPGTSPGPVAPLNWERSVIAFGSEWVPPGKMLLGLPAYGYVWNDATLAATAYWVSGMLNQAARYAATILPQPGVAEDTFTYQDPGVAYTGWFVGGRGLAARIALAQQAGWAGVVAWRLDYGVRDWWSVWDTAFSEYR